MINEPAIVLQGLRDAGLTDPQIRPVEQALLVNSRRDVNELLEKLTLKRAKKT